MANTYTQIYLQIVFTVKGRANLISNSIKEELQKYTTGIIKNRKHQVLAIKFMPDHVHIFIIYNHTQSLPDLVRDIKSDTSLFINEKRLIQGKFEWQRGYGAFSYSSWDIEKIKNYVNRQEEHHKKTKFKEEYLEMLKEYQVRYNEQYLFDWIDE